MPAEQKTEIPLRQFLLERSRDKYRLVFLAMRWAQEIKLREQSVEPPQEILSRALREILSGQVSLDEVEKLPIVVKVESKAPETPKAAGEKSEAAEKPEKEKGKSKKED